MSIVLRSRKTLAQRYRSVLKKYSTSHLWDFGVAQGPLAYAASHTAAEFIAVHPLWPLWQDTAGTVPACKINDPIGLCLDQPTGVVTLGPELVTNGDFSNGTAGWNDSNVISNGGSVTIASGVATITRGSARAEYYQTITTVVGLTYRFTGAVPGKSGIANWWIGTTRNNASNLALSAAPVGVSNGVFTATATTTYITMAADGTAGQTVSIDNVSVREVIGAHASQATTTKRPILSGRVNLLTSSENLSAWTLINSSGNATKVGNTLTFGASPSDRCLITGSTIVAATSYMRRVTLYGSGSVRLFSLDGSGATQVQRDVTLTSTPTTYALSGVLTSSGSGGGVAIYNNAAGTAGAVVNFINADLRPANSPTNIPAYQRVTSAADYDTVGFPVRALFDGVDDCLVVPSLDLSMTDKVTVVAGIQKLSDAAVGMVCELINELNSNNGSFYLLATCGAGYTEPAFSVKGTFSAFAGKSISSFPAPSWEVLSAASSISSDYANLRANGASYATSASDQGTGNFSASTFSIGARNGGAYFPFNGAIQSLAVIGNLLPDGEVQILEASANAAMGKVY